MPPVSQHLDRFSARLARRNPPGLHSELPTIFRAVPHLVRHVKDHIPSNPRALANKAGL
ncbi:hypothetical protein AXF42_Ash002396 [Apostasia shenzhenica]|uniref:Uncharacterized protein n=1 Tax=Apostasia shenzhenica TaxID=1088818 RepID=A0A2I0ANF1_9ASPA|nr:hypothetical protein AXF42_Ash002396 [Apostasia shenzhenica]